MPSFSVTPESLSRFPYRRISLSSRKARIAKRSFDFSAALIISVILSPLLLVIGFGVLCSGGQVLFAHERVGKCGRKFRCLKFRTMRVDAAERLKHLLEHDAEARAEWARDFKLRNDPRVTRMGDFLRRTSLDELPQLFNVLSGDMCLVGPRPVVEEELLRYGRYARYYLSTRPGMTGLWQVSGRNHTSYRRRVALDYTYVKCQCIGLDLRILAKTALIVARGRGHGAY